LPRHAIAANPVKFLVKYPCDGGTEGLLKQVDLILYIVIACQPEQNPQLTQDIPLAVSQRQGVFSLCLAVFDLFRELSLNPHDRLVVALRQVAGLQVWPALDGAESYRNQQG
jgi:hypothetical protein